MKTFNTLVLILLVSLLTSCGPNQTEKLLIRNSYQDSINHVNDSIKVWQNQIIDHKADLLIAKDQLDHIMEWQLGRTHSEREEQIKNQSIKIQNLQGDIQTIQNNINRAKLQIGTYQMMMEKYK